MKSITNIIYQTTREIYSVEDKLKIAISTTNQKLTYAVGAGCGAVAGYLLINLFIKK